MNPSTGARILRSPSGTSQTSTSRKGIRSTDTLSGVEAHGLARAPESHQRLGHDVLLTYQLTSLLHRSCRDPGARVSNRTRPCEVLSTPLGTTKRRVRIFLRVARFRDQGRLTSVPRTRQERAKYTLVNTKNQP
jgi:hypothetical protein